MQEFVPFLGKYFEYNAYPSAADRALMARKSMMTTRQIEVWVCLISESVRIPADLFESVSKSPQPRKKGGKSLEEIVIV